MQIRKFLVSKACRFELTMSDIIKRYSIIRFEIGARSNEKTPNYWKWQSESQIQCKKIRSTNKINASDQILRNSANSMPYIAYKKEQRDRDKPECHARGSKVPNMHFRPEYRPDRCESRCTPSWSLMNWLEKIKIEKCWFDLIAKNTQDQKAFIKTPSDANWCVSKT